MYRNWIHMKDGSGETGRDTIMFRAEDQVAPVSSTVSGDVMPVGDPASKFIPYRADKHTNTKKPISTELNAVHPRRITHFAVDSMQILRRLKIAHRLSLLILAIVIGSLAAIGTTLSVVESGLMDEKREQTRKLVEAAYSLVESSHARVTQDGLTQKQAQHEALEMLKALRYDGGNYFWVNDMQARMVMHPIKPQLNGKALADFKDPVGTYLFREMVDVVKRDGAGVVAYHWSKPGSEKPVPKISYVKGFKPWGWVVGSGVYVDDVQQGFRQSATTIGLVALLCVTAIVVVVHWIGRSIAGPIVATSEAMREVASGNGDLTRELRTEGNDEITALTGHFNQFVNKTRSIVSSVGDSSAHLATAAEELSSATREASDITVTQRAETDQIATAINELSASAQEVARNAAEAADAANRTNKAAVGGREMMGRTVDSMQGLAGEIDSAAAVIDTLKSESENIGSVLGVIRNIAEQTNLLALNAAIEAARAGEQGRGFAVVADEVRTLASRTQESTGEIQAMIERLQKEAGKAVEAMQEGRSKTRETLDHAAAADQSLVDIVQLVASITGMNGQIASAAEQQTDVSKELDKSVVHIADLAQRAVAGNEQTTAASGELAMLSVKLRELLGQFKT